MRDFFGNEINLKDRLVFIKVFDWGLSTLAEGEVVRVEGNSLVIKELDTGASFYAIPSQTIKTGEIK